MPAGHVLRGCTLSALLCCAFLPDSPAAFQPARSPPFVGARHRWSRNRGRKYSPLLERNVLSPLSASSADDEASASSEETAGNKAVAIVSALFGFVFYFFQLVRGVPSEDPLVILKRLEMNSPVVDTRLVSNGKPTVMEFYAPWCENCKVMAPLMASVEKSYEGRINFVTVDGGKPENADLVRSLRVDAIPHLAMVDRSGKFQTALTGLIPEKVLRFDFDALIKGDDLPYVGYDVFDQDGDSHSMTDILCSADTSGALCKDPQALQRAQVREKARIAAWEKELQELNLQIQR